MKKMSTGGGKKSANATKPNAADDKASVGSGGQKDESFPAEKRDSLKGNAV